MIVTPLLLLMLLLCTGFTLSRIFIVLFLQIVVMYVTPVLNVTDAANPLRFGQRVRLARRLDPDTL